MYRYADRLDWIFMIVGTVAGKVRANCWWFFYHRFLSVSAIFAGILYPLILILYSRVLDSFIELGRSAKEISTSIDLTNSSWFKIIRETMKDYFYLGAFSIIIYWIAWRNWMVAAERQILRMRLALFRSILRQEIGWFDKKSTGELSNRLVEDLDKVHDGIK